MANFTSSPGNVLFLIVSAGRSSLQTLDRIRDEQADGWQVRVIATPQAAQWLDDNAIAELTGHRLESAMLTPDNSWLIPPANRVLATPVTLNTLTKWADGHSDNLAIGLLCEAMGAGIPITAELSLSQEFANHPAVPAAKQRLVDAGVKVGSVQQ